MIKVPSWRIHKKWSKRLCGFYSEEIDRLIDGSQHDAGRYDEEVFVEQIEYVASKYGEKGVECYLLHHLLDELKNKLVSMKSRYNEIDIEHVERSLNWLKPEPMRKIRKYDEVWNSLIQKLKPELREVINDIISEKGFKKGQAVAIINKWVSLLVSYVLENLPPCVLVGSVDKAIINSRVTKSIWEYIRSQKEDVTPENLAIFIRKCIADYISEKGLYKEELCPGECKPKHWDEEKWEQFLKSLKIPCPKIK